MIAKDQKMYLHYSAVRGEWYILLVAATSSKLFWFLSEKGSTLKENNLLFLGRKFFPFRVYLFRRNLVYRNSNRISQKNVFFCIKFAMCIQYSLKDSMFHLINYNRCRNFGSHLIFFFFFFFFFSIAFALHVIWTLWDQLQFFFVRVSVVLYVTFVLSLLVPHLFTLGVSGRLCFMIVAFSGCLHL